MENITSGFSYESNDTGSMDYPQSLVSSMDPATTGSHTILQPRMQHAQVRAEIQRNNFGTQGNLSMQRTNTFEVPRFQLQYNQSLTMPTFTNFTGGTYSQIVTQRPQLSNANLQTVPLTGITNQSSFIPQAGLVQQLPVPISSIDEKIDTLPSFSSIVASAATSISTMNMQLTGNNKDADTSTASQVFAVQASQNKMTVTTPHSLQSGVDNSQVQQVYFAGPQLGAHLQSNFQQIPQQVQQKMAGFPVGNQVPSVPQSGAAAQFRVDSNLNQCSTSYSVGTAGGIPASHGPQGGPVQILISPRVSNPSFSAAGLIPLNISSCGQSNAVSEKASNISSSLQADSKTDDEEQTHANIPDESSKNQVHPNPSEFDTATSADSLDSNSPNDIGSQQMIQISKPSLKHTIKKHPARRSKENIKMSKPKSFLGSPSSVSTGTRFFHLAKFGDQSPWKHHVDCNLYELFDTIDLYDETLHLNNETLLEDRKHQMLTDPDETTESDRSLNGKSSSFAASSDVKEKITNGNENIKKDPKRLCAEVVNKVSHGICSSLNESVSTSNSNVTVKRTITHKTASSSADSSLVSSTGGLSDSVEDPPADDSSQEDGAASSGRYQQDSGSEEEDRGAVFPGMDMTASGVLKSQAFFQVPADIDDIPYLDNTDKEAEMKRKVWQATKERLEMERMDVHVKIEDSQCIVVGDHKRWQCNLCPKNYTTKHNLVTHILDHNGIKPHLCMVCGKYFKQLSHLNTHMLTHDNIKPHVCPLCGKGFTQVSHLKRHQAVHLDNKPNICDICNRGFAYPSELRVHKEKHIPGRDKCVDCGEDFSSPRLLKQHQATHEQREELTCNQCNRVFRYPSQLRDHIVSHTGTRPFICTECGMDFMKEHHLKAHMFTHTGLRPYSCDECGRAFNQKANLQRHMLIHSSERAYKCEQCDKTFTQPQTLKAHMVVHAEKKPFWCNVCGKEFGRLHNLQGHMHMHNNSKPYVCFCGSSFTLKGNLNRHKKVKHGLNESTESMEEEAVNFLSLMSERVREEKPVDDEDMDGQDQGNHPEAGEMDSLLLDQSGDPKSHRRERKSTPRKIPRQRKSQENEDSSSRDDDETSKYFTEEGENKTRTYSSRIIQDVSDEELETRNTKTKRSRRSVEVKVKEEVDEESQSDNDDEIKGEGDEDEEWCPSPKRPRLRRGAKLDSIIAKKFQSS